MNNFLRKMNESQNDKLSDEITEGLAKVRTTGGVFYNPVQQFNRDLR